MTTTPPSVFTSLPVPVLLLDDDCCITGWNPAAERLLEAAATGGPEALRGFPVDVLLPGLLTARNGESGGRHGLWVRERDRVLEVRCAPLEEGGYAVTLTDVSAYVSADEKLRRLAAEMPATAWTTDRELRFTYAQGLGVSVADMGDLDAMGMTVGELLGGDGLPVQAHERALEGEPGTYEWSWMGRTFHTAVRPLRNERGAISGVIGAAIDVTERKRAEDAYRHARDYAERVIQTANVMILRCAPDATILGLNGAGEKLTGYTEEELQGRNWFDTVVPKEVYPEVWEAFQQAPQGDFPTEIVNPIRTRCGEERIIAWQNSAVEEDGRVVEVISFGRDITQRRRVEEALQKTVEWNRTLLAHLPQHIFFKDVDGVFVSVNEMFARDFGLTPDELVGKTDFDLFPAALAEKYRADDRRLIEAGETETLEETNVVAGEVRIVEVTKTPILAATGEPLGVLGVFTDVTQRRQTQEALRYAATHAHCLLWHATVEQNGVDDYAWRIEVFDQEAARRFMPVTAVPGMSFADYWHMAKLEEDRPRMDATAMEALRTGRGSYSQEFRTRLADGSILWVYEDVHIEIVGPGKWRMVGVCTDVTERKRMEEELHAERESLRILMENIPDLIYFKDTHSRFTRINPAEARNLGLSTPEEAIGKTDFDFYPDALARPFFEDEREILRTGQPLVNKVESQVESGQPESWISTTKVPVFDSQGAPTGIVGVSRDVTEQVRAEAELQRTAAELARSNEELQQFAYVASHDLQEPLRMIASYTQLLQRRYKDRLDEDANEFIHYAVDGATRMQGLINDLLAYSRVGTKGKPFERTSLRIPLEQAMANLRAALAESGADVTHDELPILSVDLGQMTQLFQNLIGNAIKFRGEEAPRVHVSAAPEGAGWHFVVRDNGIGIDPAYFQRIFVIFQRLHSKTDYPGSGIGLSICKKIVNRHGGEIWVESEPGKGCAFHFTVSSDARQPEEYVER